MSTDQPLRLSTVVIRPDLTMAVISGDNVVEVHMSPEQALEMCDALEQFAVAAMYVSTMEKRNHAGFTQGATPQPAPTQSRDPDGGSLPVQR